MNESVKNVFDIEESQSYYCAITTYQFSHSSMLISATQEDFEPESTVYITFSEVLYFEGPFHWKGISFDIAPREECKELLRNMGYADDKIEVMSIHYKIFIKQLPNVKVKILAARGHKSSENPFAPLSNGAVTSA